MRGKLRLNNTGWFPSTSSTGIADCHVFVPLCATDSHVASKHITEQHPDHETVLAE